MHALSIATLFLASIGAQAAAPLPPIGKWVVNYADNMCVLSHDFGTPASITSLGFKPVPFGAQTEIALITPGAIAKARFGKATIVMGPSEQTVASDFSQIPMSKQERSGTRLALESDAAPLLAQAETMTITMPESSISVALPNIKPALAALKVCQDELLTEWGVDPTERDRMNDPDLLSQQPSPISQAEWIRTDDYPSEALAAGQQGAVMILWAIGTDGRVHDCRTVSSSGSAALDRAACAAITSRGRYAPILDKAGRPMVVHSVRRVIWVLPQ